MNKWFCMLMCVVMLLACMQEDGSQGSKKINENKRITSLKTYKVTAYPYMPFVIRDGKGEVGGFEIEILQAIAKNQNIRFEFVPMLTNWEMLFKSIENQQNDLLSAAMYPNPERAARFEISEPYMDTRFMLLAGKGVMVNGLADLRGKRLAVFVNSMAEREILSLPYAKEISLVPIKSVYEGVKAVLAGEADVVYGDGVVLKYYANQFQAQGVRLSVDAHAEKHQFVFLISKGNRELLATVNAGLAAIQADGTLDRIKHKWLEK